MILKLLPGLYIIFNLFAGLIFVGCCHFYWRDNLLLWGTIKVFY